MPPSSRSPSMRRARPAPRSGRCAVADRLIRDLVDNWGMRVEDILVDCLTFPIATGQEETRRDAIETIEAIREVKRLHPGVQTTLGVSNVSFGLNPAARAGPQLGVPARVRRRPGSTRRSCTRRRSCRWRGSPTSSARPPSTWSTTGAGSTTTARSLRPAVSASWSCSRAWRRRRCGRSRADELRGAAAGRAARAAHRRRRAERARGRPGRGARDQDRARDRQRHAAGGHADRRRAVRSGEMQLPFVLQSAEVMKAAVAYLEPHMERTDDVGQGHHRPGHGQGRRPRHRQEPGRHHPDQQRLHGRQHRHQAADQRDHRRRPRSTTPTRSACPGCW